jgi:hypothetical protein
MPLRDYIPRSDAEFDVWQRNFVTKTKAGKGKFGLSDTTEASLTQLQAAWQMAHQQYQSDQTALNASRAAKETAREQYTAELRAQAQVTRHTPGLTDADLAELGLKPRDTTRTAPAVPDSRPVLTIDTSKPLQHTLNFFDEETPTSRAKPDGVLGCEIWFFIGDTPPADPAQFHLAALDTSTPYVKTFEGAAAGQPVHYRVRWLNTRQQPGPWSQLYTATITG